jgi:HEAT repeat protein
MPSREFEKFYENCFGGTFEYCMNGINRKAILSLQGEEKIEAERILLKALETDKDPYYRPIIALGLLCSKAAVEPLKQRLIIATGVERILTALALFSIMKYPEAENIIIECLHITEANSSDESARSLAIGALPIFGKTPRVVQELVNALAENNSIGNTAARLLRTLYIEDEPIRTILGQIILIPHDINKPYFVSRPTLVKEAIELISTRLQE